MNTYDIQFPSALNRFAKELDESVLRWAWSRNLFDSPAFVEQYRLYQVNWFASYLYPEMDSEKLEVITKFFLCLFLIDDYLDLANPMDARSLIYGLKKYPSANQKGVFGALIQETVHLKRHLGFHYNPTWIENFESHWLDYLEGLEWELAIKIGGNFPEIRDYQLMRPHSSGVFLALLILSELELPASCRKIRIEQDVARFICLSNDLASFEKERKQNDPINELLIREQFQESGLVRNMVFRELERLGKRVKEEGSLLQKESAVECFWVEKVWLLLGGCQAWSYENRRYSKGLNGKIRY
ncbi:hypothetical protein IQ238_26665 [Pleurocapsales cyanobacterium LEGE 06147]|nr:hypothetical protein [Pleurocapsales cyanobacterium LEGE 06147]